MAGMNTPICPLFIPGHVARLRDKALAGNYSSLLVDLEDAVPAAKKASARAGAVALVQALPGRCHVRINPLQAMRGAGTACAADDIEAVVRPGLAGLIAPKVEDAEALQDLDAVLRAAERAAALPEGSLPLGVTIETARGVVNLAAIAGAGVQRPVRLMFGMADYAADLGVDCSRDESESAVPRALLPVFARAHGLPRPLDAVFTDVADEQGLRASALRGRQLGYGGKAAIHPKQVATILDVYRPKADEVAWAKRVVEAAADKALRGEGAFLLDGRMIDEPIVARARELIAFSAGFD